MLQRLFNLIAQGATEVGTAILKKFLEQAKFQARDADVRAVFRRLKVTTETFGLEQFSKYI